MIKALLTTYSMRHSASKTMSKSSLRVLNSWSKHTSRHKCWYQVGTSLCRSELQGGSARIYLIVVEGLRISTAVRDSATSIGLNPKSHTWQEALLPYMYLGMKPNWLKKDRKTDKINTKMKMSPVSATHDEMSGLTSAGNVRKRTAEGVIHVRACAWEHVLWTEICMNYVHQAVHLPYSLDWPKKSSYEAAFSQLVLSSGGREGGEARQKGKEGI